MAKENVLESRFVKKANAIRGVWIFPKIESPSVRGISDRLGLASGTFLALEFKSSKKEMNHPRTKLQKYFIDCVERYGGYGAFVYEENFDLVLEELKHIAEGGEHVQDKEQ